MVILILFLQHKISPVPPAEYSERFLAFMKAIMRGGSLDYPLYHKQI